MAKQNIKHESTMTVSISAALIAIASRRAKQLGKTLSEYVEYVLADELKDPWKEPLPQRVLDEYERDYQEFLENEKKNPQKPSYSADEFIARLDEDIGKEEKTKGN